MKIAIISDSHYSVDKVDRLLMLLKEEGIKHLIHAGDFIGQNIEKVIAKYPGILFYIARGNCDMYGAVTDAIEQMGHVTLGDVLTFDIEGTHFLVSHIPGTALNALSKTKADVLIHGHTHQARYETFNNTLILNPGSIMDGDGFMILDLASMEVDRRFNF